MDAPRFHKGFIAAGILGVALVVYTVLVRILELNDVRKRTRNEIVENARDVEGSGNELEPALSQGEGEQGRSVDRSRGHSRVEMRTTCSLVCKADNQPRLEG